MLLALAALIALALLSGVGAWRLERARRADRLTRARFRAYLAQADWSDTGEALVTHNRAV